MSDEEEVGPICIITANGMVCMDSRPALRYRDTRGTRKVKRFAKSKPLTPAQINARVADVAAALAPAGGAALGSRAQRRDIARLAVFLAEAAELMKQNKRPLSFQNFWTIVKRP